MYKPLTDWWKDKLTDVTEKGVVKDVGVKEERVELSKRLSPVVAVTSQSVTPRSGRRLRSTVLQIRPRLYGVWSENPGGESNQPGLFTSRQR